MTPATQIAVELHNSTRWHFLYWINPVRAALDRGCTAEWIRDAGMLAGPKGLAPAEVPT